jgi:hypothetical protein
MTAGMHLAVDLAGPGLRPALLDGQGIHVGAQTDARSLAALQGGNHAGATDTVCTSYPRPAVFPDQPAGIELFETQFGMGMQLPPQADHFIGNVLDTGRMGCT